MGAVYCRKIAFAAVVSLVYGLLGNSEQSYPSTVNYQSSDAVVLWSAFSDNAIFGIDSEFGFAVAVGDVNDDGGKARRMAGNPLRQEAVGVVEHVAHGRASLGQRVDPDRYFAGHFEHLTRRFVGDVLDPLIDSRR